MKTEIMIDSFSIDEKNIEVKIYEAPEKLTPNQIKWLDRYILLSNDSVQCVEESLSECTVIEWDTGWTSYTVDLIYGERILFVWNLYSHNDDKNVDGLRLGKGGEAFKMIREIAKRNDCKIIEFYSNRDPEKWMNTIKNAHKDEYKKCYIYQYLLRIEI